MAVILALIAALAYGVSDFLGGVFAKRSGPWQITVVAQASAAVVNLVAAFFVLGSPRPEDWVWAAVGGSGAGAGAAFLYRGLARSRMGVVAPISAVGSALLPVLVGLLGGERPALLAVVGIVVAFPAILLISAVVEDDAGGRGGVVDGLLAGIGFGMLFICLDRVGDEAGLMPLALTQITALLAVVGLAVVLRQPWWPQRPAWRAVVMGPLSVLATGGFLFATTVGLLSVVSVVAALYPAATVVMATALLRERILPGQAVGLALAAVSVTCVALA